MGLNPGGSNFEDPMPSVEEGNAYWVERWGKNGAYNSLQRQVQKLFHGTSVKSQIGNWRTLLDNSLDSNFIPFRSSSYQNLQREKEVMEFSEELWKNILPNIHPHMIFCIGNGPKSSYRFLGELFGTRKLEELDAKWGSSKVTLSQMSKDGNLIPVVAFPHLSRFQIFARDESYLFSMKSSLLLPKS